MVLVTVTVTVTVTVMVMVMRLQSTASIFSTQSLHRQVFWHLASSFNQERTSAQMQSVLCHNSLQSLCDGLVAVERHACLGIIAEPQQTLKTPSR